jgi:RimJ/RimL family protein N-acetyltransferase
MLDPCSYYKYAYCTETPAFTASKKWLDRYRSSSETVQRDQSRSRFHHKMSHLDTERLILRRWRDSDREPFARMNADPQVMEFFPAALSRVESDGLADRIEAHFAEHGFGLFAAELRATREFVGYIGLAVPAFEAAFTPCVEIGWRIAADQWGQGLATEGAREVLWFAFGESKLDAVVSFTVPGNRQSRRVMEKIGMTHDPRDDFEHPNLPEGHPLRRHVLYRLRRSDWMAGEGNREKR